MMSVHIASETAWRRAALWIAAALLLSIPVDAAPPLRAGAASAEMAADDSMALGGGIGPRYVKGQDAPLRAAALVIQSNITVAIISVDVVKLHRDFLDAAARDVEAKTGIPFGNILITSTHTHGSPATSNVHGVKPELVFQAHVRDAIVQAAVAAKQKLQPAELYFADGEESSVGQNSRLLLSDGTIYWTGKRDDAVRPTGPFDPQLPVFAFKGADGRMISLMFNHSSHNIGSRGNKRSPGFYGLAAQELETELGGTNVFLTGAIGSTHVLDMATDERVLRTKDAVKAALAKAEKRPVAGVRSVKNAYPFKVRVFDEKKDDAAVTYYTTKHTPGNPQKTIDIFRAMRKELAPHMGETRQTWLHVIAIGDIALVGIPGQMFTGLGMEIKQRSPFRYTYVVGLANDEIGYLPDPEGYDLGGYQVWTGLHSYSERGAGVAMVNEAVRLLQTLAPACLSPSVVPAGRKTTGGGQ